MKQTIFNVKNLFTESQLEVQNKLRELSSVLPMLDNTEKDYKRSPVAIVDKSLSYVDDMDNMLIFRALVDKGYIVDNHIAMTKLNIILNPLKYQNLNIVKFGLVKDNKSTMGKYDLILILPDDRDMIYASNVKNLEYILADSNKTDDKIMKESEFNVLDYPRICLFEYELSTHTLTHVDTRDGGDIEDPDFSKPVQPDMNKPEVLPPPTEPGPMLSNDITDVYIPEFIRTQSEPVVYKTIITDLKDKVSVLFNKPEKPIISELQSINETEGTI